MTTSVWDFVCTLRPTQKIVVKAWKVRGDDQVLFEGDDKSLYLKCVEDRELAKRYLVSVDSIDDALVLTAKVR